MSVGFWCACRPTGICVFGLIYLGVFLGDCVIYWGGEEKGWMMKKILLTRQGNGIFFVQDGVKYNLYDLKKYKDFVIKGSLDLSSMGLTELPDLSTVKIKGNFNCSHNMLTSLRGAPKADIQGAVFDCGYNQITTLKHLPMRNVGEAWHWEKINCNDNRLKTLKDLIM